MSRSDQARPFLKWAGGKRSVLPSLMDRVPSSFGRYHEPFVGGGALFFALHARFGCKATLSDSNLRLVRTYRAVRDEVDRVVEGLGVLAETHDEEQYYRVRAQSVDDFTTDAEVAVWMIYLNKTGFNGLYRVNKKGGFNVPIGRQSSVKICDAANLRACSEVLAEVEILHSDFTGVGDRAESGDFVYFDPPYVPLSKSASFTSYTKTGFGPEQQEALRDLAHQLKTREIGVLLSNHDHAEVRALYQEGFALKRVEVARAINSKGNQRGAVGELVIW